MVFSSWQLCWNWLESNAKVCWGFGSLRSAMSARGILFDLGLGKKADINCLTQTVPLQSLVTLPCHGHVNPQVCCEKVQTRERMSQTWTSKCSPSGPWTLKSPFPLLHAAIRTTVYMRLWWVLAVRAMSLNEKWQEDAWNVDVSHCVLFDSEGTHSKSKFRAVSGFIQFEVTWSVADWDFWEADKTAN